MEIEIEKQEIDIYIKDNVVSGDNHYKYQIFLQELKPFFSWTTKSLY